MSARLPLTWLERLLVAALVGYWLVIVVVVVHAVEMFACR